MIRLVVLGAPRLPNKRQNHWSSGAKEARQWREDVVLAARLQLGPPPYETFQKATVQFDCYRSREPDHDNLVASLKPLLDGLQPRREIRTRRGVSVHVGCGIIATDEPSCIGSPVVRWHHCKRIDCRVVITIHGEGEPDYERSRDSDGEGG